MRDNSFPADAMRAPPWARYALLLAFLYFPVCGLRELPMGGGGRYLNVLAGPLALVFLLWVYHREWRSLLRDGIGFASPFLPLAGACLLVLAVYPAATIGDPFSRIFWAGVLAVAAMRIRIRREAIFSAAAAGALAYFAVATRDIYVLGAARAGTNVNEIIFAETAMLTGGLALAGAFTASSASTSLRAFWLLGGGGGMIAVALSGSRGPLLALLALWVVVAVNAWRMQKRAAMLTATAALLGFVVAAFSLTSLGHRGLLAWNEASAYYAAGNFSPTSIGVRLELWRVALTAIVDQPILGYGYTTVMDLSQQLPALRVLPPELLEGLHHFHNDWIHALMAGGLVLAGGLGSTVALLAWQARKDLARLWLLGAMLVFGLTDLAFFRKPTLTLFIAAWALLFASSPRTDHVS